MHLIAGTNKDNQVQECSVDFVTGALEMIMTDHANIHTGDLYTAITKFNMLAAGTRKITFQTPATRYMHFRPSLISSTLDKLTIDLYEGSSGNTAGTPLTAVNRNRISTKIAASVVTDNQTVTTNGTAIDQIYLGGSTTSGVIFLGSGAEDELVLKQNTVYTLLFTNGSASAQDVAVRLKWYEENIGV